jgi:hypothetical protein
LVALVKYFNQEGLSFQKTRNFELVTNNFKLASLSILRGYLTDDRTFIHGLSRSQNFYT